MTDFCIPFSMSIILFPSGVYARESISNLERQVATQVEQRCKNNSTMDESEVRKETVLAIAKSSHYSTGKDHKFSTVHSFEDCVYSS